MFRKGVPRHWPLILPIAVGIGFVAQAVISAAPTLALVNKAVSTPGTFVGAFTRPGGAYRPMFRFKANDGSIRTFTAEGGWASHRYRDGEQATVLYDRDHPEFAKLSALSELWLAPLAVGIPGLLLAALGTWLLAVYRRRERASGK